MGSSKIKYQLTCKNCTLDHTHETDSMDGVMEFWKNWNKKYGEDMKCIHEYEIRPLS